MIKLSKRLFSITKMIENGRKVLDIGTDHAYVPIYLSKYKNNECIISEIKDLSKAKNNLIKYNVDCDCRIGNGLSVLRDDEKIDYLIISGLGGINIINLLKDLNKNQINYLVLQPTTDVFLVRKELMKRGYKIIDEDLVKEDNIYYQTIKFEKGKIKYNLKELKYGPCLIKQKGDLLKDYLRLNLNIFNNILNKLPRGRFIEKINIKREIKLVKNILKHS